MAIIPYWWLFCPCPCLRAPLVQLFVMYCSESVPLCNMYNPMFHAVLQELTWLPQEDLIYLPISMLTSQEKKRPKISVLTYKAWIENTSNITNNTWWGMYIYVCPSNPGKLPTAKIKIQEDSWKTSKGWIQSVKHTPTDNHKLLL